MKSLEDNHTRPAFPGRSELSLNLGNFNQIKVSLGKLSLFQEIKDCLFFIRPRSSTALPILFGSIDSLTPYLGLQIRRYRADIAARCPYRFQMDAVLNTEQYRENKHYYVFGIIS